MKCIGFGPRDRRRKAMRSVMVRCALAITSGLVVLGVGRIASAGDTIYALVDKNGAVTLTNVPDDPRYRPLDDTAQARTDSPDIKKARPYEQAIAQTAGRFGLDPALLHAVVSVESGYNAEAVSPRGAAGLMQLMPDTARRFGVQDVFDPAENLRGGAQYLAELLGRFGNLQLALAAYNAGEGAVIRHGNAVPPYPQTARYVPKVLDRFQQSR
jgi:soluble lytic murein transglycosylase-like protein